MKLVGNSVASVEILATLEVCHQERLLKMRALVACFFIATAHAVAVRENPIRKIVNVLQGMSKETEDEGDRAQELFEKFMCYCQTNEGELTKNVEEARAHVDEVSAGIKELSGSNAQLEQELKDLKEDVEENTKAVEEATAQRKKEADAFAAESTETSNSIGSLDKAIPALKKGLEEPAAVLAAIGSTVAKANGEQSSLLQAVMRGGSQAASGGTEQILGILEQMRDDFKANLQDMIKSEEEAVATFNELTGAKKQQIAAATEELNEKGGRVATQTQQISDFQEDLDDTSAGLAQDEKFLSTLKQNCATKTKEHEAFTKMRQEELVGISEAIKILNSDDALELLKKTVPQGGAYFLQTSMRKRRSAMAKIVSKATYHAEVTSSSQALSFVQAKMQSRMRKPQVDLAPLKKSVTDMIENLKKEQGDDDAQFKMCKADLAETADEKATLQTTISNGESKMETIKNEVRIIKEELEVLANEIKEIDIAVEEATVQRKKEKTEFSATASELAMTVDLLGRAKAVLEKMYQPKLIQDDFPRSNSEWENSLTSFLHMDQPGPPPETASYSNKGAAGMGVVGMLNTMIADVKAQQKAGEKEEADSQADFEQLSADMGESKKAKKKDIVGKEASTSRLKETEKDLTDSQAQAQDELAAVESKEHALHAECDFLLQNYEERKKARSAEIESVNNAFSILSGADFGASFFQAASETHRIFRHFLQV